MAEVQDRDDVDEGRVSVQIRTIALCAHALIPVYMFSSLLFVSLSPFLCLDASFITFPLCRMFNFVFPSYECSLCPFWNTSADCPVAEVCPFPASLPRTYSDDSLRTLVLYSSR